MKTLSDILKLVEYSNLKELGISSVSTKTSEYHVPCVYAEDTKVILAPQMIDDVPQGWVTVISRHLVQYEDHLNSYWHIILEFNSSGNTYIGANEAYEYDFLIPVDSRIYTVGWSSRISNVYTFNFETRVEYKELIDWLLKVIKALEEHNLIRKGVILKDSLAHWTTYYTFSKSQVEFWEQIDVESLKAYINSNNLVYKHLLCGN